MSATNRGGERRKDDLYETPEWLTHALLDELLQRRPGLTTMPAFEMAAGNGAIVRVMRRYNDIWPIWIQELSLSRAIRIKRNYGVGHHSYGDFLATIPREPDNIFSQKWGLLITNPPFSLAYEFVEHSLKYMNEQSTLALLMPLTFLGSADRVNYNQKREYEILISPVRPSFTDDGKTDAMVYGWFLWGYGARPGEWSVLDVSEYKKIRSRGNKRSNQGDREYSYENQIIRMHQASRPSCRSSDGEIQAILKATRSKAFVQRMLEGTR